MSIRTIYSHRRKLQRSPTPTTFSLGILPVLFIGLLFLAPRFVLATISLVVLIIGSLILYAGYRLFRFKREIEKNFQQMEQCMESPSTSQEFFHDPSQANSQRFEIDGQTVEVVDAE